MHVGTDENVDGARIFAAFQSEKSKSLYCIVRKRACVEFFLLPPVGGSKLAGFSHGNLGPCYAISVGRASGPNDGSGNAATHIDNCKPTQRPKRIAATHGEPAPVQVLRAGTGEKSAKAQASRKRERIPAHPKACDRRHGKACREARRALGKSAVAHKA